jgi:diguanylate cyclase (GGDEF)-like protein/PAS domain S-box-containing protein
MGSLQAIPMAGSYDYRLVALSIVLAMGASYAALDLAGRVTAARQWSRGSWLIGGATAMGLGIWAMHYIGMLAFRMPMPVLYDYPTVGYSLLAAIGASAIALFVVSRETMGIWQEIAGSVTMGGGIAAMHYIGMAAMRVPAKVSYDSRIVAVSLVLAIAISFVALTLTFRVRDEKRVSLRKIVSAVVMGSAIPVMHYMGMAAARFYPSEKMPNLSHAVSISHLGIAAISITSLLVLILAMTTAFLDRLLAAQKSILDVARESESHFRMLAEAIPQMIWTSKPDGTTEYFNDRWYDYTGLDDDAASLQDWGSAVHPQDLAVCLGKWEHSVESGETFEVEYRLRRASDAAYRWHLGRAVPIKDSKGKVVKWFGTCTDIDDQRHNQETLEEQVRERTGEVVAANARLKQEMEEREQAQGELNDQNTQMLSELTKRSARGILLAKMGKLLQSSSNIKEAVSIVLGLAPKLFPDFRGALILLNSSRSTLEVAGTWSECELPESTTFEADSCWALRTGQRHFVEAHDQTARCSHANTESSYLCIPIMSQGGAAGILHLQSTATTREPFESELLITSSFAEQVGLSISNLKLQEALRQQSTRDVLTGLFNRRYLEESLEREIRRAGRTDQPVAIIMFDLDHFKTFNDTFGHEAGDKVLREMGAFLSKSLRAEDIPCRFGGEEFLLILPSANCQGAQSRAERLRSGVKDLNVTHQGRSVGMITISVGVAAFPVHGSSVSELIAAADAALYRAKREGRDRVCAAETADVEDVSSATAVSAGSG